MIMQEFRIEPMLNFVDTEEINEQLKGATHIDSYTIDEKTFGGRKTLIVFAFYPDEPSLPVEAGVMQKIADKLREEHRQKRLLFNNREYIEDLGKAEKLRGYLQGIERAIEFMIHIESNFSA